MVTNEHQDKILNSFESIRDISHGNKKPIVGYLVVDHKVCHSPITLGNELIANTCQKICISNELRIAGIELGEREL